MEEALWQSCSAVQSRARQQSALSTCCFSAVRSTGRRTGHAIPRWRLGDRGLSFSGRDAQGFPAPCAGAGAGASGCPRIPRCGSIRVLRKPPQPGEIQSLARTREDREDDGGHPAPEPGTTSGTGKYSRRRRRERLALLKINKAQFGTAVWLNGEKVGEHFGCFSAGYFDLTEAMHWGRTTNW